MEKIKTHTHRTKYIIAALGVITLAATGYAIYATVQLSHARDQNTTLERSLEDTKKQLKKAQQSNTKASNNTASDITKQTPRPQDAPQSQSATVDTNFVALLPHGGFLASQPAVTFEWAPHAKATKYVVEIKRPGQANYPANYPVENIVTTSPGQNYETFSLKKTLQSGDYVWRVTALKTQNGQDIAIQSTEDRNYQVR